MTQTDTCKSCRYWWTGGASPSGQCRRRAPLADQQDFRQVIFPITALDDWCGEYESAKR